MVKPKPQEKIVTINFTIPQSEKEKWSEYADNLGFPLARVIKETMNKALYQEASRKESINLNLLMDEIIEIKTQLNNLSTNYIKEIDKVEVKLEDTTNLDEIKFRVISLLNDLGPLSLKKLEVYLGINDQVFRKILSELKKSQTIDFITEDQKWVIK